MREFPKEIQEVVPNVRVWETCPVGVTVKLQESFIREQCGVWKPQTAHLAKTDWTVLNHYYLIGSRKELYGGAVVGVPYADWMTLAPKMPLVKHTTYGTIGYTRWMNVDGKRWEFSLTDTEDPKDNEKKKLCVLVLTDWHDGVYREVVQPNPVVDGPAGDMF